MVLKTLDWNTSILCMWVLAQFPYTGTAYKSDDRKIYVYNTSEHFQISDVIYRLINEYSTKSLW